MIIYYYRKDQAFRKIIIIKTKIKTDEKSNTQLHSDSDTSGG